MSRELLAPLLFAVGGAMLAKYFHSRERQDGSAALITIALLFIACTCAALVVFVIVSTVRFD